MIIKKDIRINLDVKLNILLHDTFGIELNSELDLDCWDELWLELRVQPRNLFRGELCSELNLAVS